MADLPYSSVLVKLGYELDLDVHQRLLLHVLRSAMNSKNVQCWKSLRTLQREVGCSRATLVKALRALENRGIIKVTRRGTAKSNVYQFGCFGGSANKPPGGLPAEPGGSPDKPPSGSPRKPGGSADEPPVVHQADHNKTINKDKKKSKERKTSSSRPDDDEGLFLHSEGQEKLPKDRLSPQEIRTLFGGSPPPPVDLLALEPTGESFDLWSLIWPFRRLADLKARLGTQRAEELDRPHSDRLEARYRVFSQAVLELTWSAADPPNDGAKKTLLRAVRSGLMERFGFDPDQHASFWRKAIQSNSTDIKFRHRFVYLGEKPPPEKRLQDFVNDHKEVRRFLGHFPGCIKSEGTVDIGNVRQLFKSIIAEHGLKDREDILEFCFLYQDELPED